MFYVGAISLFFGVAQSRRFSLGLILLVSALAAGWISLLGAAAGHSILHSIREGMIGAWSSEVGVFSGLLLDRLVLHPHR
jgi:hypothetical protein